jgi:tRNA-splicing ligase RtcB (3'-phosphate/5'-hydroxy nucleic acid ligase)
MRRCLRGFKHCFSGTLRSRRFDQLINIANLPGVVHVKVIADVHLGKGATVGSVIATEGIVSSAAVGVDIGCDSFVRSQSQMDKRSSAE